MSDAKGRMGLGIGRWPRGGRAGGLGRAEGLGRGWLWRTLAAALGVGVLIGGASCTFKGASRAVRPQLPPIDAPSALRGTLLTQADFLGVEPTLVSGIGLVVGLAGTGGQPLDERVAGHLEREMGLMGVGDPTGWAGTAFEGLTPRQILADPNTAAVVVSAAVPPGAPPGSPFDVAVRALNATSLEGGRLFTTEMRLGAPSPFGSAQQQKVGEARGDIYTNPFAEPGSGRSAASRINGRVLGGGVVTESLDMVLRLRSPSHARARLWTSAINSRFPQREGDREPTARGRDDTNVAIRVPRRYLDRPGEFLNILKHMQIDAQFPQVYAQRYTNALIREPYLANELSWALQALGEPALPFVRELYTYPEIAPRLAALQAGAGLGDALAVPHLKELIEDGPEAVRPEAIALLGRLEAGPSLDLFLRDLTAEPELTIRVAAYEALAGRAERERRRALLEEEIASGVIESQRMSLAVLEARSRAVLPPGTLQGVSRIPMAGKFFLDRVPYGDPLIYVTQQDIPKVVLFGESLELERPLFVSAWSNRLMLVSGASGEPVRVRYETVPIADPRTPGRPRGRVLTHDLEPSVTRLIDLLAHDPSPEFPEPGFDMSYAEVVGALYEVSRNGGLRGAFATEQDRLTADLLAAAAAEPVVVRPETQADAQEPVVIDDFLSPIPTNAPAPTLDPNGRPILVVPLKPNGAGTPPSGG